MPILRTSTSRNRDRVREWREHKALHTPRNDLRADEGIEPTPIATLRWVLIVRRATWLGHVFLHLVDWLRGKRWLAVILALALVAAPTLWALFPHLGGIERWKRICIMAGWLVVAGLTAIAAQREKTDEGERAKANQTRVLKLYLSWVLEDVEPYIPTVYIWDENRELLIPIFPDEVTDPFDERVFRSDQGVTGAAFTSGRPAATAGDNVSRGFGLSPRQQSFFSRYKAVASVPLYKKDDTIVGALSVIAEQNDRRYVDDDGVTENVHGLQALRRCAEKVEEALPHLLGVQ